MFFPNPIQKLISILFLPLTVLYCIIVATKRSKAKPFDFGLPIISIGNLLVGGTGKTPLTIAIAKDKKDIAIILRGYGRKSKGLYLISHDNKILENVETSGDEAMLLANALPNATVIVCENRIDGILKAKELGNKAILLDDGYRHHNILKYDILIRPKIEPTNIFCLPSCGYRETKMMYSFTNMVLNEDIDFKREVTFSLNNNQIENLPKKLILLTAISKPNRLLEFLPSNIKLISYPDHYSFTKDDIDTINLKYPEYNIITTQKDEVKLKKFNMQNLYIMKLHIEIEKEKSDIINSILNGTN